MPAKQKVYAVTFHVTDRNLGTVLSTLAGSADLVSVVPTSESASSDNTQTKSRTYEGGRRDKGITGEELILKTLSSENKIFTYSDLSRVFEANGFAAVSAGPPISRLVKMGKVRALGSGKYCMANTFVHAYGA